MKPETKISLTMLGIVLTKEQEAAFAFLEHAGLAFLTDFGYGNCVHKVAAMSKKETVH